MFSVLCQGSQKVNVYVRYPSHYFCAALKSASSKREACPNYEQQNCRRSHASSAHGPRTPRAQRAIAIRDFAVLGCTNSLSFHTDFPEKQQQFPVWMANCDKIRKCLFYSFGVFVALKQTPKYCSVSSTQCE